MTTVLLALLSATAYGTSDFIGGLVSRRTSVWSVAFVVQASGALILLLAALVWWNPARPTDLAWGAVGGLGSGVGISFLFRGMAAGRMSVVAPLSAVGAALIPVVLGVTLGERPGVLVVLGVLCAFPGIWLVSREGTPDDVDLTDSGVVDGLVAGVGFGGMFAALGQLSHDPGLWPLATAQGVSVAAVVLTATVLRFRVFPVPRAALRAGAAGPLSAAALLLFLLAAQAGLLTVAAVISSLYPAVTILLAVAVLKERIHRAQTVGLALCGVTVALVAAG